MRIIISTLLLALSLPGAANLPDCDKCVDTADVAPKAITAGKLAPDSVTRAKLAPQSVGVSELADGAIKKNKLAPSLLGALSSNLVLADSNGARLPLILLYEYSNYSGFYSPESGWDGLVVVNEDLLVRLRFGRYFLYAREPARLYYSGANCSGDVFLDTGLPYGSGTRITPMFSPKTLVVGGTLPEAPLEVFTMGGRNKLEMQMLSFRDIGKTAPFANPRVGPFEPDPYDRPVTDSYPPIIRDVCINEQNAVENLQALEFVTELDLTLPLSIKVH